MARRYLCWDEKLAEYMGGARVCAHKPEKKNLALICDNEWDGPHNGYASIVKFLLDFCFNFCYFIFYLMQDFT